MLLRAEPLRRSLERIAAIERGQVVGVRQVAQAGHRLAPVMG